MVVYIFNGMNRTLDDRRRTPPPVLGLFGFRFLGFGFVTGVAIVC